MIKKYRELLWVIVISTVLSVISSIILNHEFQAVNAPMYFRIICSSFNAALIVIVVKGIYQLVYIPYTQSFDPEIQAMLTFWEIEYNRNPIMENGRKLNVDCNMVLLILLSDRKYVDFNKLPDIGNYQLNRYYTSMYMRMVDLIGLPHRVSYRRYSRRTAILLQAKLDLPYHKPTGNGLVNMIPEYTR